MANTLLFNSVLALANEIRELDAVITISIWDRHILMFNHESLEELANEFCESVSYREDEQGYTEAMFTHEGWKFHALKWKEDKNV